MRAEDLMLGDWLYFKVQVDDTGTEPVFETMAKRVTDLSNILNGIYAENTSTFAGADIFPIPLTHEILEENGFTHEQGYSSEVYRLNECFLVHYENKKYLAIWISEDGNEDMNKVVTYVHELQHILKDIKIKKEIIL